jgi:hypothetical protein
MHRNAIPTTYDEARETLNGRDSRKIANNTTLVDLGDGSIGLRLHTTTVVTFHPDGSLVLKTGGWQTVTTKDRLNRVVRAHGWNIYAEKRVWHIAHRNGAEFEFGSSFTIPPPPREPEPALDATVHHDGSSLFLVRPRNDATRIWLEEHTDGQWFGPSLVVEHRFVTDLVEGLREHGFTVGGAA